MDRTLLGQRSMISVRRAGLPVLVVVAVGLTPAIARGQMSVCVEALGTRSATELPPDCSMVTNIPVGIDECADNAEIRLRFDNVPSTATLLDFWRSTGANCSQQLERDGTDDTCIYLTSIDTDDQMRFTATMDIRSLLDCEIGQPLQTVDVYVLPTDMAMFRGEVTSSTKLRMAVDTSRPDAPDDVEGGSGDTGIPVTWNIPSGDLFEHRVYVYANGMLVGDARIGDAGPAIADAGSGTDAGSGSDAGPLTDAGAPTDAGTDAGPVTADAGPIPSADAGPVTAMDAGGPTGCDVGPLAAGLLLTGEPFATVGPDVSRVTLSGVDLGLAYGESAAVVVVAVDQARNASLSSAPVCIERIETRGLCDTLDCGNDGCDCRAAPGSARGDASGPFAAALAVLLVWCARRWRRR